MWTVHDSGTNMYAPGHRDLASGLLGMVERSRIDGYACSSCGEKHVALMGDTITRLPSNLVLNLMRFDFDYNTLSRVKLTAKFAIPLVVDMRPFIAGGRYASVMPDVDETPEQQHARLVRCSPHAVVVPSCHALAHTAWNAWFAHQSAAQADCRSNMVWLSDLRTQQGRQRAETVSASLDGAEHVYDLFAIIIHRGTAYQGHYIAYIRDTQNLGHWTPADTFRNAGASEAAKDAAKGKGKGNGKQGNGFGKGRDGGREVKAGDMIALLLSQQKVHAGTGLHYANLGSVGSVRARCVGGVCIGSVVLSSTLR